MNYQEWLETRILKTKEIYEDYPNQMIRDLKQQVSKYNLEVYSYHKDHYVFSAILKDKEEDRYISLMINDLAAFKYRNYNNVALNIMKNPKIIGRSITHYTNWNNIARDARNMIERNKQKEIEKNIKNEVEEIEIEK